MYSSSWSDDRVPLDLSILTSHPWSIVSSSPWSDHNVHSCPESNQSYEAVNSIKAAKNRRSSAIRNLLKESEYGRLVGSASLDKGVDALAFHRYYDEREKTRSSSNPTSTKETVGLCGSSFQTASPRLVLHSKVESLLKLLAQSVHVVFATLCSRKGRRKDRECASLSESKLYLQEAVLERNIPETDLKQLVDLPSGLGYEEWLASHTIDFFHHINLLYGTVCEFCTLTGCPDMSAPGLRHYLWFDEKGKKTRVAAPQYVDYVMTFTQNTVNDETIFPTKFENEFPSSFESIVKKIHRLLFHVVAHLYHAHFREVVLLSLHSHLNCLFAHFVLFNDKFRLIDEKETEILHDLVVALKIHPANEVLPSEYLSLDDQSDPSHFETSLEDESCFANCSVVDHLRDENQPMATEEETAITATVTQVISDAPLDSPFIDTRVALTEALP